MEELKGPRPPTRLELDHLQRRINSAEVSVREVRQEVDRIRGGISEALDTARKQAHAALEPLQHKMEECESMLRRLMIREEEEERARKMMAEHLAQADTRVEILLGQKKSAADITGQQRAILQTEVKDKSERRRDWTKLALDGISFIVSAGAGAGLWELFKHWLK